MLAMIPTDFDVSPLFRDADASLFIARRPDVWHLVLATAKKMGTNSESINIAQFHWPRYSVARALVADRAQTTPELVQQLGIQISGNQLSVTLLGRQYLLPAMLLADIRRDLPILERSAAEVEASGAEFKVRGAVTSSGFPVAAAQRSLAEAIAFERVARKTLDPHNFGIYSAFCTWRDFIRDDESKKANIATGMTEEMLSWDPETFGDPSYWGSVFTIQERLWGSRVWGPGVDPQGDRLFEGFSQAFERLSSIQFAQFVLMNGMHAGGPFHALAALFGLIDFEGYKHWRTREFQPDSTQEQVIRAQSSFIELLGLAD